MVGQSSWASQVPSPSPSGSPVSAGHWPLDPSQLSATSQGSDVAGRHTVPAGCTASGGHVLLEPVHVSATSQAPACARQVVPAGCLASLGQASLEPVQTSVASHTSTA